MDFWDLYFSWVYLKFSTRGQILEKKIFKMELVVQVAKDKVHTPDAQLHIKKNQA